MLEKISIWNAKTKCFNVTVKKDGKVVAQWESDEPE